MRELPIFHGLSERRSWVRVRVRVGKRGIEGVVQGRRATVPDVNAEEFFKDILNS